ncbi:MAG: hypothetical protein HRF49_09395 [bacterium]|jgi:hypothetical protein
MNPVRTCAFLIVFAAAMSAGMLDAEETPFSFSTFAFLSGEWSDGEGDIVRAAEFLGEGSLRFDVSGKSPSGADYIEVWIAGFDPRGILYLDVYSPGGWRTAMEGKMIVPAKVWAFESAPDPSGNMERRVFTRLGPDEFALKSEVMEAGGDAILTIEKRFRKNSAELVPPVQEGQTGT